MKVKDAMHKGVDWVSPDTPVTELAKLMCEHDIGSIPIGLRCPPRDRARCDDARHPLLPVGHHADQLVVLSNSATIVADVKRFCPAFSASSRLFDSNGEANSVRMKHMSWTRPRTFRRSTVS